MARLKIDLNNVEIGGGSVPPGKYLAELTDCQHGESSTGKPRLQWEWEIVEGEYEGSTFRSWTSLQPNALFGLKGHLIGLGETVDDVDMDTDDLIGRKAYVTLHPSKYKDRLTGEDREGVQVAKIEVYKRAAKKRKPKKEDEDDDDSLPF